MTCNRKPTLEVLFSMSIQVLAIFFFINLEEPVSFLRKCKVKRLHQGLPIKWISTRYLSLVLLTSFLYFLRGLGLGGGQILCRVYHSKHVLPLLLGYLGFKNENSFPVLIYSSLRNYFKREFLHSRSCLYWIASTYFDHSGDNRHNSRFGLAIR